MPSLAEMRKAVVAAVGTAVTLLTALQGFNLPENYQRWIAGGLGFLTVVSTYLVPNATVAAALTPPKTPHAVAPAAAPWPGITVQGAPPALPKTPKRGPSGRFSK